MTRHGGGLWLLAAATALAVAVLTVYPMFWLVLGSLQGPDGIGFDRYRELFARFAFAAVLGNSWIYALGTAIGALALGTGLAVLVTRTDLPGKAWFRLATVLAFVSPPWLTAMAYVYLASPNSGLINVAVHAVAGVKPFNVQSMAGMIFVSALFLYAFVYLTVEGALTAIDGAFEEAARTAGASPLGVILRVTLPLIAPSLIAALVFSLIIAWGLFATPAILGMPSRIYVFATQLYLFLNAFPPRLEVAAAMGTLFCLSAAVLGLALYLLRRRMTGGRHAVIAGKGRRPALLPLGRARPALFALCLLLTALAVVLPYAVVLWMSLKTSWFGGGGLGDLSLENFVYVVTEYGNFALVVGNSLAVAGMEAAIVLLVALSVAYLAARTQLPVRHALTGAAYYTVLVPSVAFLAGVIWAWIKSPVALYGTLLLIAMTQGARSLPIAVRNLGDGLGQIERALEEAATTCGAGRLRTALQVTVPLLRPVLLGTFSIVFLSGLRDLNTPLFLGGGSPETLTLAVVIFQFWSESRMGESAALTIVLLLLTLVIFLPLYRLVGRAH